MFRVQMKWNKQGDWENTVYQPMEYAKALNVLADFNKNWAFQHQYRIISTGASR